jgi:hypothetical protein
MDINLSVSAILAGVLFGSIGFVAFNYGRKTESFRAMGIGVALMIYPYVVPESAPAVVLYGIGAALTAALFMFRD